MGLQKKPTHQLMDTQAIHGLKNSLDNSFTDSSCLSNSAEFLRNIAFTKPSFATSIKEIHIQVGNEESYHLGPCLKKQMSDFKICHDRPEVYCEKTSEDACFKFEKFSSINQKRVELKGISSTEKDKRNQSIKNAVVVKLNPAEAGKNAVNKGCIQKFGNDIIMHSAVSMKKVETVEKRTMEARNLEKKDVERWNADKREVENRHNEEETYLKHHVEVGNENGDKKEKGSLEIMNLQKEMQTQEVDGIENESLATKNETEEEKAPENANDQMSAPTEKWEIEKLEKVKVSQMIEDTYQVKPFADNKEQKIENKSAETKDCLENDEFLKVLQTNNEVNDMILVLYSDKKGLPIMENTGGAEDKSVLCISRSLSFGTANSCRIHHGNLIFNVNTSWTTVSLFTAEPEITNTSFINHGDSRSHSGCQKGSSTSGGRKKSSNGEHYISSGLSSGSARSGHSSSGNGGGRDNDDDNWSSKKPPESLGGGRNRKADRKKKKVPTATLR